MNFVQILVAAALVCVQAYAQMSPMGSPALLSTPTYMTELQQANTNTAAGTIKSQDLTSDPFLGTLPNGGLAQNVDYFAPCTINVPHVHPRGSEIYYAISGTLEFGVQEEASTGRFIVNNITSGQNAIAPQGLPHYIQNNECTGASLLQFWNNADYGTVILYANIVNNFPDRALMAFTNLDQTALTTLKNAVPKPTGAIVQSQSCLARCAAAGQSAAVPAAAAAMAPSVMG